MLAQYEEKMKKTIESLEKIREMIIPYKNQESTMIQELLKKIEDSYYWDARVKSLECNYFGDEVKVVFEDDEKNM